VNLPQVMPSVEPSRLGTARGDQPPTVDVGDGTAERVQVVVVDENSTNDEQSGVRPARPSTRSIASQMSREEAARAVRQREDEVLSAAFGCFIGWSMCFALTIMILALIARKAFLLWMVIEIIRDHDKECDVPLKLWTEIMITVGLYGTLQLLFNKHIYKYILRWTPEPGSQPPRRVVLYNHFHMFFGFLVFLLCGLGWYLTEVSGASKSWLVSPELPACRSEAPRLFTVVQTRSMFGVISMPFVLSSYFGVRHVLHWMMRRGMLHTSKAAPAGALEKNTVTITEADFRQMSSADEPLQCSICIDDFDFSAEEVVVKTRACDHLFHKSCLQNWLNVDRSCPLCREDLAKIE